MDVCVCVWTLEICIGTAHNDSNAPKKYDWIFKSKFILKIYSCMHVYGHLGVCRL